MSEPVKVTKKDVGTQTPITAVGTNSTFDPPSSTSERAVFSPKSAAVALSSLYQHATEHSRSSSIGFQERLNQATSFHEDPSAATASQHNQQLNQQQKQPPLPPNATDFYSEKHLLETGAASSTTQPQSHPQPHQSGNSEIPPTAASGKKYGYYRISHPESNVPWGKPWNPPAPNAIDARSSATSNMKEADLCGKPSNTVHVNNPQFVPNSSTATPSVSWDAACMRLVMENGASAPDSSLSTSLTSKSGARPASKTSLVTPTPKKSKLVDLAPKATGNSSKGQTNPTIGQLQPSRLPYSRRKKSLGVLAENFLKKYEVCEPGTEVIVDEAAVELGVERRRIYDVVNILESIQLVVKKGKNTYSWLGKEYLPHVFGRLQEQAIVDYAQDALQNNLISKLPQKDGESQNKQSSDGPNSGNGVDDSKASAKDNKSLAKLSQQFLQVFLVGHNVLSLPQASDKIQGATSEEDLAAIGSSSSASNVPSDPKEFRAAAARGLKTKIRRLYDIANVFLSVGLLRKKDVSGRKMDSTSTSRRPNFQWAYHLSPIRIKELYAESKNGKGTIPTIPLLQSTAPQSKAKKSTPVALEVASPPLPSKPPIKTPVINKGAGPEDRTPVQESMLGSTQEDSKENKSHVTPETNTSGTAQKSDSSRVILANIHQTGGAWDNHSTITSSPNTPSLTRSVTLPQSETPVANDTLYI